tara:strand:- start:299 stop:400 length:102 start_codon:yes stop_codon:yes gene_type:complete
LKGVAMEFFLGLVIGAAIVYAIWWVKDRFDNIP